MRFLNSSLCLASLGFGVYAGRRIRFICGAALDDSCQESAFGKIVSDKVVVYLERNNFIVPYLSHCPGGFGQNGLADFLVEFEMIDRLAVCLFQTGDGDLLFSGAEVGLWGTLRDSVSRGSKHCQNQ